MGDGRHLVSSRAWVVDSLLSVGPAVCLGIGILAIPKQPRIFGLCGVAHRLGIVVTIVIIVCCLCSVRILESGIEITLHKILFSKHLIVVRYHLVFTLPVYRSLGRTRKRVLAAPLVETSVSAGYGFVAEIFCREIVGPGHQVSVHDCIVSDLNVPQFFGVPDSIAPCHLSSVHQGDDAVAAFLLVIRVLAFSHGESDLAVFKLRLSAGNQSALGLEHPCHA